LLTRKQIKLKMWNRFRDFGITQKSPFRHQKNKKNDKKDHSLKPAASRSTLNEIEKHWSFHC